MDPHLVNEGRACYSASQTSCPLGTGCCSAVSWPLLLPHLLRRCGSLGGGLKLKDGGEPDQLDVGEDLLIAIQQPSVVIEVDRLGKHDATAHYVFQLFLLGGETGAPAFGELPSEHPSFEQAA